MADKAKILVVEDDMAIARGLVHNLSAGGVDKDCAVTHGFEERFVRHTPCLGSERNVHRYDIGCLKKFVKGDETLLTFRLSPWRVTAEHLETERPGGFLYPLSHVADADDSKDAAAQ